MHRILVREIMQTAVHTIHPDALVADAANLMDEFNIRRLPVVDEDDFLVGIITDSDVREAETAGSTVNPYSPGAEAAWLAVSDIMSRDVITILPDATVGELVVTFIERKIGGVPVIESDPQFSKRQQLVGIVTEVDIFAMIADAWKKELEKMGPESPDP